MMETATIKKKIEALAAEASPNSVTPPMVANIMSDLTDMLGATRSVQDVNVLRRSGEITLEFVVVNNETGAQEVVNVILPSADPARAGLMSASDSTAVRTLKTWFDAVSDNTVVANLVYDEAASETDSVCLKVLSFNHLGARKTYSVKIPEASATKAGVMSSDDKKKLDELEGGASPMVAARLRLGVNKTGQHFRIHGKGLLPTDEVRLYRNVHSISHWPDSADATSQNAIKRKGWREVKYLAKSGNYIAFPYLELATDVMENSPLANEVNVLVRVKQDGQDVYAGELIDFFVDYYLYVGTGDNDTKKDTMYIRNGRKTKKIDVDSTGEYFSTARTVDWAVLVLRDGKPITDFMPFKWLVETAREISAPMDIQACIDDTLKVSAVPYNHYAGNGASKTVELPNLEVVTSVDSVEPDLNSATIRFISKNLKNGRTGEETAKIESVSNSSSGVMTPQMLLRLNDLYTDYLSRKYQGRNVVVLGTEGYGGYTIAFNGNTYQTADVMIGDGIYVLDLGKKKTINNKFENEKEFMTYVRDIYFLPEGITNYDDAFGTPGEWTERLDVHCHIDMSQCTSAIRMFFQRRGLKSLDVSGWDVSKMKDFSYMFALTGLEKLDVSKWDVSSAEKLVSIFTGSLLETIDTSKWNTASATSLRSLFQSSRVRKIDVSQFDTSKVTDMGWMFWTWNVSTSSVAIRNKEIVGLTNFDTSKVTDFSSMFAGLRNVTLDLSSFSLESAENVADMFGVDEYINASQHVTLGKNFFNAPKISSLGLSALKMSAELKQSLIDCFDRKAAGQQTLTLSLPTKMLSGVTALTEEEKAAIKAKGYELT